jgi:hypothetical protein
MLAKQASDSHPDRAIPDLAGKSMDILPSNGGTTAVHEAKTPAMQRADDFAIFNPSATKWAVRVRASTGECVNFLFVTENGQSNAVDLNRLASTKIGQRIKFKDCLPFRHETSPDSKGRMAAKPSTLRLYPISRLE